MSENCVVLMRTRQRAVARLGSGVWDYGNMPCALLAVLGMRVACLVLLVFSFHFVESTVPAIEGRPHICFVSQVALKCLLILYCTPAHGGECGLLSCRRYAGLFVPPACGCCSFLERYDLIAGIVLQDVRLS